jgi:hypothetical protein
MMGRAVGIHVHRDEAKCRVDIHVHRLVVV